MSANNMRLSASDNSAKWVFQLCAIAAIAVLSNSAPATAGVVNDTLHSFSFPNEKGVNSDGAYPVAGITVGPNGVLYGAANLGGANSWGTLYRIDAASNFKTLYSFKGGADGGQPRASLLVDTAGDLWGAASVSKPGAGTIFKYDVDSSLLNTLRTFTGANGDIPVGISPNGTGVYGATAEGGAGDSGVVFKSSGADFLALHTFSSLGDDYTNWDGARPQQSIVRDYLGNSYGTAMLGGANGWGTVFKIDSRGQFSVLHAFGYAEGALPWGGVSVDNAGNVYGTTVTGGASGQGVVFKIAPSGAYTVLHSFAGKDGAQPFGALTLDPSGNLFGTTLSGGSSYCGVVYTLTTGGSGYKVLRAFNSTNGANPYSGVTLDGAGHLFGTTIAGGRYGAGTVYRITDLPTISAVKVAMDAGSGEADLSVTAADALPVYYSWSVSGPGSTKFSRNDASNANTTTVNFSVPGTYTFTVTAINALGGRAKSSVNVLVTE